MRQCIRQEEGVAAGYEAAKKELRCQDDQRLGCCLSADDLLAPNENLGALLYNALLARDLNHAMSVITYSVRCGSKEWFHDCLHRIKQKVRNEMWTSPNIKSARECHPNISDPWHAEDGTFSLDADKRNSCFLSTVCVDGGLHRCLHIEVCGLITSDVAR